MEKKPDGKRTADQMGFSKAELVAKLEKAKKRVVYIEQLLSAAQWVACDHELVKIFPSGMRDNGENENRCAKCGKLM